MANNCPRDTVALKRCLVSDPTEQTQRDFEAGGWASVGTMP